MSEPRTLRALIDQMKKSRDGETAMIDLRAFLGTHICKAGDSGEDCSCPCDCCMGHCSAAEHLVSPNHMPSVCAAVGNPTGEHINLYPMRRPPADDRFPAETERETETVTAAEFEEGREAEQAAAGFGSVTGSAQFPVYDMGDGDEEIDGQGDATSPEVDDETQANPTAHADSAETPGALEGGQDGAESETEQKPTAHDRGSPAAPMGQPQTPASETRTAGTGAQGETEKPSPRQRATVPISNTRTTPKAGNHAGK